jgi:hypothetical protein
MSELALHSLVSLTNQPGSFSAPTVQASFAYLIPQPKVFVRFDLAALTSRKSQVCIDMKQLDKASLRAAGIEVAHTKYHLKKEAYAIMISRDRRHMVYCNVNERVVVSSEADLFSEENQEVHTESKGMFSITCSGASLSKDRELFAVGDFIGHLKVYKRIEGRFEIYSEAQIINQVRYLHFHDYHNEILLIGTISGPVYVWNLRDPRSSPIFLFNLA